MANSKGNRAEKRRLDTQRQREKRAQSRICGWCKSPGNVDLIDWYGKPPRDSEELRKPLQIPICKGCLARLDACWPNGVGLCGYCGEPADKRVDWLGPIGLFGIMMCAECHARLSARWPEGDVCGHCAMPANEFLEWTGLPHPIPICGDCKARLNDSEKQGEEPLFRRVYSWLVGE